MRSMIDKVQSGVHDTHERRQLIIGLDFGTAFTKVVIGAQTVRHAVSFGQYAHTDNPYLLPSVLSILNNQECSLGFPASAIKHIEKLKMRLIERELDIESKVYCAAFLALVLRYAREWLLDAHKNIYGDRQIKWFVNIGLPTDSYHDNVLVETYQEIARTAWTASVLEDPVSLEIVRACLDKEADIPQSAAGRSLLPDQINAFPEFVVQLVGYIRSPRRQEGLHALADIGAGTVDFTTFNIYQEKDREDKHPIFACMVEELGTQFFIRNRLQGLQTDWMPSPFETVPPDKVFLERLTLNAAELKKRDEKFSRDLKNKIADTLIYTKKKRDPKSKHWKSGIPVFLCGGGRMVDFYRRQFDSLEEAEPPGKIKLLALAKPEDLQADGIPKDAYDRLSVAYGLSFNPLNIGRVIPQSDIEDYKPPESEDARDRFIRAEDT